MIKFSLILNSRGRPQLLSNFLDSIVKTTTNINEIEVIVGLDWDDPTVPSSLAAIDAHPFTVPVVGNRPVNLIHALNALAVRASGFYLYILNDDVVFLTSAWDTIAWDTLSTYCKNHMDGIIYDGIIYGRTHDLSIDKDKDGKYAAFPIISKKACEILGFCIPTEFYSLGGDVAAYRIYEAVDRVVDLDITLDHVLHRTIEQVIHPDKTAYDMRKNTYQHRIDWKTYDISPYVEQLQKYIQNF